jgi:hypothetical protein
MTIPENTGRDHAGRWRRGASGNKAGKPKGTRHKATLAAETLLEGEAEALTRKAIELALKGDIAALRLCLDRIIPARKAIVGDEQSDPIQHVHEVRRIIVRSENG